MVSLLLIGEWSDDFSLPSFGADVQVTHAPNPQGATRLLATGTIAPPELVVLAEPRRGQFNQASLAILRRQLPLVRVWRLLGSWCEGESRSGRPPAACMTTYWHQWAARFASEVDHFQRGQTPGWALPVTATPDERILAATDSSLDRRRSGTIAICATSATAAHSLSDLCRAAGYDTIVVADDGRFRTSGPLAIVWDTEVDRITDAETVAELRGRAGGAPLVAIVGFPRTDDVELARQAGVAAVVSKPLLAGDLFWHLDRVACCAS